MSRRFTRIVLPVVAGAIALAGCSGSDPAAPTPPRPQAGAQASAQVAGLTRDTEESKSFPLPEGTRGGANAPLPTSVDAAPRMREGEPSISPGAPTDAEIEAELREMKGVLKDLERRRRQATSPAKSRGALTRGGNVKTPLGAPARIAQVIAGGNAIARFPYVWGGGHGSFIDSAYDCSGSVSYALAAAGLLDAPLVSGQFAQWGEPGPGRWITIYAHDGHVFMTVAGIRFDTSGRDGPLGSRWQTAPRSLAGFSVRHPPGL